MLSGGLDSAWCLYYYLSQGLPVRTHHVTLKDWEGRQNVEDQAVAKILAWARKNDYGHLITHSQSSVDFGSVKWIPKNFHLWAYWCGTLMANPANKSIDKIVIPRHADAFTSAVGPQRSDNAYKTHVQVMTGRTPTLVYPMLNLTKAEVVQSIPKDLLGCCWWCRRPKRGKPCHECQTCKQVDPALGW